VTIAAAKKNAKFFKIRGGPRFASGCLAHGEQVEAEKTGVIMDNAKAELENRAKNLQQVLQEEGYGAKPPVWDEKARTWDIYVKYESLSMLLMLDLDDPLFVRVLLPNFWKVEPEQLESGLLALDVASKTAKGAKVYFNRERNQNSAAMEFLYNGTGLENGMLIRYLVMVANVAKVYVEAFKEHQASESSQAIN
jgi:hypothetical protein